MSRRRSRVLAFQALYCYDIAHLPLESLLEFEWEGEKLSKIDEAALAFARNLTAGTIENLYDIDEKISSHLRGWDINRLKKVDLAILRISAYSLLYQKEAAPASVVIEEAICICKDFGSDSSLKFINAVLDAINKFSVSAEAAHAL